ncbi:MAG: tetratricopeptide repeat protein [Candidatus Omnitrophica bacterium]|nr:tetratricopeptide repeat protein [Candidatus Omnitrophota bacterium]
MTPQEIDARMERLKQELAHGLISEAELKAGAGTFRWADARGMCWSRGIESGQWHVWNGRIWLPSVPPDSLEPWPDERQGRSAPPPPPKPARKGPGFLQKAGTLMLTALVGGLAYGVQQFVSRQMAAIPAARGLPPAAGPPAAPVSRPVPPPTPDTSALYAQAEALVGQKSYPEAIAKYGEIIRLNPSDARAFFRRGLLHYELRQLQQAFQDYSMTISLDAANAPAYNELGNVLFEQKRWQDSEGAYREARRLDPFNAIFPANLAGALYQQGRMEEARQAADEAIRLGHPQDHWVFKALAGAGASGASDAPPSSAGDQDAQAVVDILNTILGQGGQGSGE